MSVEWHERDDVICVTYVDDELDQMVADGSVTADSGRETGFAP